MKWGISQMQKTLGLCVALLLYANLLEASERGFEFTGAYWLLKANGTVRSGGAPADIKFDLGVRGNKSLILGKAVYRPARKHRILVEFIPYRLRAANVLGRGFAFAGTPFPSGDAIAFKLDVNYFFGGYQYDIVNRERGHIGLLAGLGYFQGKARISSYETGASAKDSRSGPLPLIGMAFRGYLTDNRLVNINGEVKGMSYGGYGEYLQGMVNLGIGIAKRVTLQIGYTALHADLHDRPGLRGMELRFAGPMISVEFAERGGDDPRSRDPKPVNRRPDQ